METLEEVIQKVLELEKRVDELENKKHKGPHNVENRGGEKKTLSDFILELRDNGFFKEPKTADEVYLELRKSYPCEKNRVEVALIRLTKKRHLRIVYKEIEGKKYKAYAW